MTDEHDEDRATAEANDDPDGPPAPADPDRSQWPANDQEQKHTPAPWEAIPLGLNTYGGNPAALFGRKVEIRFDGAPGDQDADLALIEAAPYLLEACKIVVEPGGASLHARLKNQQIGIAKARAAIAKATP